MTKFLVKWEIEVEAESFNDAAAKALSIQRDPDSRSTFFKVKDLISNRKLLVDPCGGVRTINTFGYNHPIDIGEAVVDCRTIQNPYRRWARPEPDMLAAVMADPMFEPCVKRGVELLRTFPTVFVGCSYGKHRSRFVAAEIANRTGAIVKHLAGP